MSRPKHRAFGVVGLALALVTSAWSAAAQERDADGLVRLDLEPAIPGVAIDVLDAGVRFELLDAARRGDVAGAEALIREAYEAALGSSRRAAVFRQAADAVVTAGYRDAANLTLAFSWIDWGLDELRGAPADERLAAYEDAIETALTLADLERARGYARAMAGLEDGWRDAPDGMAGPGVSAPDLVADCPDVIEEAYLRVAINYQPPSPVTAGGALTCRYEGVTPEADIALTLSATASWQDAQTVAAGRVADPEVTLSVKPWRAGGTTPLEADGRVYRREEIRVQRERLRIDDSPARSVSAEYRARRSDPVMTRAAVAMRQGPVLYAAEAATFAEAWPANAMIARLAERAGRMITRASEPAPDPGGDSR